jgi:hypothetical protein
MVRQQAMNRRMSRTNSSARNFELNPALGGRPNDRFGSFPDLSGRNRDVRFTPIVDIVSVIASVRKVPIVLKKSFWDDDQNFPGPLMRFARAAI